MIKISKSKFSKIVMILSIIVMLFVTENEKITNQGVSIWFFQSNSSKILIILLLLSLFIMIIVFKKIRIPKLFILLVLLIFINIIPMALSLTPPYWGNLTNRIISCLFFLFAFQIENERDIKQIILFGAFVISLQVILTYYIIMPSYGDLYYKDFMVIPIAASNHIGVILISIYIYITNLISNKYIKIIMIPLIIISIILTKSRTSVIILFIISIIMIIKWIYCNRYVLRDKRKTYTFLIFSIILIFILSISIYTMKSNLLNFFLGFSKDKVFSLDGLFSGRLKLIKEGIGDFRKRPIMGHGLYYNDNQLRQHNIIVMILYETGLVGLLINVFFISIIYKKALKNIKNKYMYVYLFIITVLIFQSMIEVGIFTISVDFIFMIILTRIIQTSNRINNVDEKHLKFNSE